MGGEFYEILFIGKPCKEFQFIIQRSVCAWKGTIASPENHTSYTIWNIINSREQPKVKISLEKAK